MIPFTTYFYTMCVISCNIKILSWEQDKTYEDGNNRQYRITLDANRI